MLILNNKVVMEKVRKYCMDPTGFPDLPNYIVAVWRVSRTDDFKTAEELITEKILTGAIFNTERMEDLRRLYFILTREDVTDLRLYQITPQAVVRWIEFLGVFYKMPRKRIPDNEILKLINQRFSITEIAFKLDVTKGAISQRIKKLQEKGLIELDIEESAYRRSLTLSDVKIFKLTEKGKRVVYKNITEGEAGARGA